MKFYRLPHLKKNYQKISHSSVFTVHVHMSQKVGYTKMLLVPVYYMVHIK
jgi:phage terminase large subunit GpA-like protein